MTAKTGGGGGVWVVLESPKPPRVADVMRYWTDPPPERSDRCAYWVRQINNGWRPNRRISMEGYDYSADWYGVFIWEWRHVLRPLLDRVNGS